MKKLDRWTVVNVYFRPHDKDGHLIVSSKDKEPRKSDRQKHFERLRKFKVPDWRIEELWQRVEAERQRLAKLQGPQMGQGPLPIPQ